MSFPRYNTAVYERELSISRRIAETWTSCYNGKAELSVDSDSGVDRKPAG
jgi:hypothetical protein